MKMKKGDKKPHKGIVLCNTLNALPYHMLFLASVLLGKDLCVHACEDIFISCAN
jgi:hypothetical protein